MTVRLTIADFVYMLTTNQPVILQPLTLTIWTTLSSHATSSSDLLNLVAVDTSDQWLTFQRLLHEHTKFCTNQTILSKYIHSLTSRPSSMTVGDCRWPLYCLSSPLFPVMWHLLQLNGATATPLFYVVHPLSFGSSLVTSTTYTALQDCQCQISCTSPGNVSEVL